MKNLLTVIFLLSLILVSCNDNKEEVGLKTEANTGEPVEVTNPWFRPAAKGANTALFFDLKNNTDSVLIITGAASDLAGLTEIHETFHRENDMMGMRHVDSVVVEPTSTFNFEPGAHHVMLVNLHNDLNLGDTAKAVIQFKNHDEIEITAEVKDLMPEDLKK